VESPVTRISNSTTREAPGSTLPPLVKSLSGPVDNSRDPARANVAREQNLFHPARANVAREQNLSNLSNEASSSLCSLLFGIQIQIKGQQFRALLDSGASENFMSPKVAERLNLEPKPHFLSESVRIGDGSVMPVLGYITTHIEIGEVTARLTFQVASTHDDIILGMPFLQRLDPQISWKDRSIMIKYKGKQFRTTSPCFYRLEVVPDSSVSFTDSRNSSDDKVSHAQLGSSSQCNTLSIEVPDEHRTRIEALLQEYQDIFPAKPPPGLPP